MRRLGLVSIVLVLVALASGCGLLSTDVETLSVPDPDRWVAVQASDLGQQTIVAYVPAGQEKGGWTEVVTVQAIEWSLEPPLPQEMVQKIEAKMRTRGGTLDWEIFEYRPESVLYQWTIRGSTQAQDQTEVARLVAGRDALLRASYTFYALPVPAERLAQCREYLGRARIVKGKAEAEAAQRAFAEERARAEAAASTSEPEAEATAAPPEG